MYQGVLLVKELQPAIQIKKNGKDIISSNILQLFQLEQNV
jgi:hypothetical protein